MDSLLHSLESHNATAGRSVILHISFCPTWRNRQTFIASQRFASLLLEITFKHYRAKSGMPPPSGPRGAVSSFSFFTEFFGSRYGLHRKVGLSLMREGVGKGRTKTRVCLPVRRF